MTSRGSKVRRPDYATLMNPLAAESNDTSPAPGDKLLDLETIAERLGLSVKSVRRIIGRGELAHHRVGHTIRVSELDYAEYLARCRCTIRKEYNK